jgi:hypothetical protein
MGFFSVCSKLVHGSAILPKIILIVVIKFINGSSINLGSYSFGIFLKFNLSFLMETDLSPVKPVFIFFSNSFRENILSILDALPINNFNFSCLFSLSEKSTSPSNPTFKEYKFFEVT